MATSYIEPANLDLEPNAMPLVPPGEIAPQETVTPAGTGQREETTAQDYGPNNEKLPEKLVAELRKLVQMARRDSPTPRRDEVRRIQQARNFWKGLQYEWFDGENWTLPWEARPEGPHTEPEDAPRYAFVTNYFQALGLIVMAALSQNMPPTKLWPQDPDQAEDLTFAEAGKDIIELIERNNRIRVLQTDMAFYLYTDGKIGAFTRYVVDGQRFGFHPETEMAERPVKVSEDAYRCAQCGTESPAEGSMGLCPQCGIELSEENFLPGETMMVPTVQQVHQIPNGQEVITIVGGLELKTPPRAQAQHEFGYLIWDMEVHKARRKAAFPHTRKKKSSTGADGESDTDNARQARLDVTGATEEEAETLETFSRCWLRPWWFENLENDDPLPDYDGKTCRQVLLELFPTGCYVAFAGDIYCESRNESMDDGWRVEHALPGDGQDRPAMGTSFVSVQERINTMDNITMESIEYGIPSTYYKAHLIDGEALGETVAEPGAMYPVEAGPQEDLRQGILQTEAAQLPPALLPHGQVLANEVGPFLTGAMPALFGGSQENVDTYSGQELKHQEALGRIGLIWRRMLHFKSDVMMIGIDVFRKNRPDDVKVPILGEGGQWKAKFIRKADLKGNIYGYPDTDAEYPASISQKRAILSQLMQSPDPMIQEVLGHPENLAIIKRVIGLEELVIPDEEARNKQHREIELLLQSPPEQVQQLKLDPVSQQPVPEMVLQTTVPVDMELDDHEVEFETIQRWASSEAGQRAKLENPGGFANVRTHALQHLQALQMEQQRQAMMQAVTGGKGKIPAEAGEA